MTVKTDPELVPVLTHYLTSRSDLVVEPLGDGSVSVAFTKVQRPEAQRRELELRLRGWRPYGRDARAEVVAA